MIPGIAPVTVAKVGGGGPILGTVTVGEWGSRYYGYAAAGNVLGFPPFGSISGDAANYIDGAFIWDLDMLQGLAVAKNTTTAELIFQDNTYSISYEPGDGWIWVMSTVTLSWPTSGTHTFEIIDP